MNTMENITLLKKTPVCACSILMDHMGVLFRNKYKFLKEEGKEVVFPAFSPPMIPHSASK